MQIQHIEETFHWFYFTSSSIDGLSLKYIYIIIEKKSTKVQRISQCGSLPACPEPEAPEPRPKTDTCACL